jgi:hypothetical protein
MPLFTKSFAVAHKSLTIDSLLGSTHEMENKAR